MTLKEQGKLRGYGNLNVKLYANLHPQGQPLEEKNKREDLRRAGQRNGIEKEKGERISIGPIFIHQINVTRICSLVNLDISETIR